MAFHCRMVGRNTSQLSHIQSQANCSTHILVFLVISISGQHKLIHMKSVAHRIVSRKHLISIGYSGERDSSPRLNPLATACCHESMKRCPKETYLFITLDQLCDVDFLPVSYNLLALGYDVGSHIILSWDESHGEKILEKFMTVHKHSLLLLCVLPFFSPVC